MKVKVDLCAVENAAFIIASAPTGIFYQNECGGTCCTHPELEGYLIPLTTYDGKSTEDFFGKVEDYWSYLDDDEEYAKKVLRECLSKFDCRYFPGLQHLSFDEEYEGPMGEAWVPVKFELDQGSFHKPQIISGRGILTYPNSD